MAGVGMTTLTEFAAAFKTPIDLLGRYMAVLEADLETDPELVADIPSVTLEAAILQVPKHGRGVQDRSDPAGAVEQVSA